jgi:hypothetical protein
MGSTWKGFEDFLNTGFGKRATQYLKDGATFKVLVDGDPFSLTRSREKMEMSPGVPEKHDVFLEISSSAIKFLCDAKTEDDVNERLEQLIYHSTPDRFARMKIDVEPTEKGRIDFYWQGFFFWARRMGFLK